MRIDVRLLGRLLDLAHLLGAMGERVLEEALGALAALGRLWLRSGLAGVLAGFLARLAGEAPRAR